MDFVIIHETEIVENNLSPIWNAVTLNTGKLCDAETSTEFKIECLTS